MKCYGWRGDSSVGGSEIAGLTLWTERLAPLARARLLEAIRERMAAEDSIFVWGYCSELYVFVLRWLASCYSNTNYLMGMLLWENHLPGVDTSAHVVPGVWDVLMAELDASRPPLIVDTAVGDHRFYAKYPIASFPRLQDFLDRHYTRAAVVDDGHGRPVAALWVLRS